MSGRLSYHPLQQQPFPSKDRAEGEILDIFARNSSWIWVQEEAPYAERVPEAPGNEQRVFRKTWSNADLTKRPSSTTFVVAADNYCAIYVNGILLHALNEQDDWNVPLSFSIPVNGSEVLYAIRVVNKLADNGGPSSAAGLRVSGKVTYEDGSTSTFFTGSDQTWVSQKIFGEGWELPGYDDRTWPPAAILPRALDTAVWGSLNTRPQTLLFASTIPSIPQPTVTSPNTGAQGTSGGDIIVNDNLGGSGKVTLSTGALAGAIIGPVLFTFFVTALVTYLWARRRFKKRLPPSASLLYTPYDTQPMREVQPR